MSVPECVRIGDVCWRQPEDLTPRQREMVALLAWRYRDQMPPGLAPAAEPKLSPKPQSQRRWDDGPIRRQRGPRA